MPPRTRRTRAASWILVALLAAASLASRADDSDPLIAIDRFTLDNGMTFLLVDRPQAANISAGWVAHVGSADDPDGLTGLSHMLEHMMFKGTRSIGTRALKRDLDLIEREDHLWEQIAALEERARSEGRSEARTEESAEIDRLRQELQRTIETGRAVRRSGELDLLYAGVGATGLNAVTMQDLTAYYVSLPVEKIELWFWLESDRLLEPILREFHIEKQVVIEERRLRVESSPTGALEEDLLARLWPADPYGRPAIGYPEDLVRLSRPDARRHFADYYSARRLTAVLVGPLGDLPIRQLAERYFGRLASGQELPADEPALGPTAPTAPLMATCDCRPQARVVYPTVGLAHPDAAALEVLVGLLNGRTGRLHRSLVLEQEIAFSGFARQSPLRRAGQLSLTAEAKGETRPAELLAALDREIDRLRTEPIEPHELQKVRNRLRADTLRRLREPAEVMMQLLVHTGLGQPDHLNRWIEAVDSVTPSDIQRVLETYMAPEGRVVGLFDRGVGGAGAEELPSEGKASR